MYLEKNKKKKKKLYFNQIKHGESKERNRF